MRRNSAGITAGVAGVVMLSALAAAQQNDAPRSPWKYYPEDARANTGDGGPAPKRDLTGKRELLLAGDDGDGTRVALVTDAIAERVQQSARHLAAVGFEGTHPFRDRGRDGTRDPGAGRLPAPGSLLRARCAGIHRTGPR